MASDDIDLTSGDPDRGSSASERRARRRQRAAASEPKNEGFTAGELRHQLGRAFDGLAKGREASGDTELAEAIREEGDAMTEGFVTLTDNVPPFRMPLVILLNVLITILAFSRVGGILWERYKARRLRRQQEREMVADPGSVIIEEG